MAPPGVGINAARIRFGAMAPGGVMDPTIPLAPVRAFAEPPHVDEAAGTLAEAPVHAIAFGFTSSAYVLGPDGEAAMIDRLHARTRQLPVVATCSSTVEAARLLGVRSVALVHPPWFDSQLNERGRRYYEVTGFEVMMSRSAELPSAQSLVEPASLFAWIRQHASDQADAIVIGGNGFRAVGVIEELEAELGRPVLTANQVLLWAALRAAGAETSIVQGYGRLFSTASPPVMGR
jgi:maleate isomerase